ncbi:hypothetical protein EV702DRAFT_1204643 [Suillus placidus]|uniref:Uncharacterized protein n=1 Tax=Suillus placidus TaxID=48579 RepID=A0A9P6ZGH7_9AGAM|nr:hypothetical protein EV702DRAFT_1204643 [Suillus placidus]
MALFFNLKINEINTASQTLGKKFNITGHIPDWLRSSLSAAPPTSSTSSIQRSTISKHTPPLGLPRGALAIIQHSHLYKDEEDNDELNKYGFASGAQVKASTGTHVKITPIALNNEEVPQNMAQHAAILIPEELDVIEDDNTGDFIMLLDLDLDIQPHPSAYLTPLASPTDWDAYLEFPSLAQPPLSRYVPPMYSISPKGSGSVATALANTG